MSKPKPESSGFEFKIEKAQESFAWTTEKVEQLMLAIEEGYKPTNTPFYEGNTNLRKGNIVFEYTKEEIQEIKKCAKDILYFADNYCTVMTDEGLMTIHLRDYQREMLKQFQRERFNIVLASRQVGKCALFSTEIMLLKDGKGIKTTLGNLYFEQLKLQRPLTFLEKSKWFLWNLYEKLESFDRK